MRRALFLIALLPFAAGCGARTNDLAASADAMSDVTTSRVEIRIADRKPLFIGQGMLDFAHDRGQISMASAPGGPAMPGGEVQIRFFGRTSYAGWTFSGKTRWQKSTDSTSGSDRFIPGAGGPSPQDLLHVLIKSSRKIDELGSDEIRGVSATHYRAHFDPKKFDDNLAKDTEAVVDAWIDDAGLVRRVRVPDSEGVTVVDYFDFGVEVGVEAPLADEIVSDEEFSKLIEKWCKDQPKDGENLFCDAFAGEGSGGGTETGPVETVPNE